ncbi:MAG: hypothetical protein WA085_13160, partial [Sphingobium sp.]
MNPSIRAAGAVAAAPGAAERGEGAALENASAINATPHNLRIRALLLRSAAMTAAICPSPIVQSLWGTVESIAIRYPYLSFTAMGQYGT